MSRWRPWDGLSLHSSLVANNVDSFLHKRVVGFFVFLVVLLVGFVFLFFILFFFIFFYFSWSSLPLRGNETKGQFI